MEIDNPFMSELKFKEITERIIGASMKVHAAPGNGFRSNVSTGIGDRIASDRIKVCERVKACQSIIKGNV